MNKNSLGVIVGRFQTNYLHDGYEHIIKEVLSQNSSLLIILGSSPIKLSRRNPLNFDSRKSMLLEFFSDKYFNKHIVIKEIHDNPSDEEWAKDLDNIIQDTNSIDFPYIYHSTTLYGSRDSFIPHYKGKHQTQIIEHEHNISSSEMREKLVKTIQDNKNWRAGVIYGSQDRFPISYQCVDVAIWRPKRNIGDLTSSGIEVLLGRKKTDLKGKYRLIGGFVDPEDESLEMAAIREAKEETGNLSFNGLSAIKYIHSKRVNDWRYKHERDKIMTAVFALQYFSGKEKASDDIEEVKWFDLDDVFETLVESHKILWHPVCSFLLQKDNQLRVYKGDRV